MVRLVLPVQTGKVNHQASTHHPPSATTEAGYLWSHAWVPAGVVAAPQLQMSGGDQRIQNVVLIVHIEGVNEVLRLAVRGQH